MALAKRIILFLLTNILVMAAISFIVWVFNLQPYLRQMGLDYGTLAIFCFLYGMGGSLISLSLSRIMAKYSMGVQIIDPNTKDPGQQAILQMVYNLAKKAGLPAMPEVGTYNSPEVNAFATGPTKRRSLVAISTGLLQKMTPDEVNAVVGHEVTHVANGDMVTMTLLQGIVNAFVMFLANVLAFAISRLLSSSRDSESGGRGFNYLVFNLTAWILQIVFMILGSIVIAAFTRRREYRADLGGARLAGTQKMIEALQALKRTLARQDPEAQAPAFQAMKISNPSGLMNLFASHPPLDARIARLQKLLAREGK